MIWKRGRPGFAMALSEFRKRYVTARLPNLTGYAYRAEMIDVDEGRKVMEGILRKIEEINSDGLYGHPDFRLRGEKRWRSVVYTDDYPVPLDEPWNGDEEEEPLPEPRWQPRTLFNRRRR